MANGMLIGFVATAASIVGLMDYTMQTRRADLGIGELGLGAYVASMGTRFSGMKAGQYAAAETAALRRQDRRLLLPEAPEGWVMHEWNEGDRARLLPSREVFSDSADLDDEFLRAQEAIRAQEAMENDPMFQQMAAANERLLVAREKAEIRFYQRGENLVALQLSFNQIAGGVSLNGSFAPGEIQDAGMAIIAGNMTAMSGRDGFAVVGGVPFGRELGMFGVDAPKADPATAVQVFRAQMGPELQITVRALAPDDDVKDLLAQIDFDTLNLLLTTPLQGVGSAAPVIAADDEQAIATAAVDAEAAAVIARGQESGAQMRGMAVAMQQEGGAGVLGMLMQRTAEQRATAQAADQAAEEAAAAAPPAEGSLAAMMAGAAPAAVEPAAAGAVAAVPSSPAAEVRVRRAGATDAGNCTMTATGKRCSLPGN